ncbi:hypothetical protein HH308_17915 [Gordonia sp. TBRC 11910]|uniref:MspA protein n=1 Tax=Gordonia asplenii TaxID=2725283 RepID=A0A848KW70_9ACTN|nr:MspA family porin [Gordonia asplenii]NMO03094.1 hypothetical protein [Gordonia asplenii]
MQRVHRRAAVTRATSLAALSLALATQTTAAHADSFVRLPNSSIGGYDGLRVAMTGMSARVSPSLASNGAGRVAWLSGDVTAYAPRIDRSPAGPNNGPAGESTMPGTNGAATNSAAATLTAGYIVGCQVAIGNLTLGGSLSVSQASTGLSGALSIPLTPGTVTYAYLDYKNLTKPGTYHINYRDYQVNIEGCGGYAQARPYSVLETTGNDHQKLTVYGRPFSLG